MVVLAAAFALVAIRGESASGQQPDGRIAEDPEGASYAAGELVVTYEDGIGDGLRSSPVNNLVSEAGGEVVESLPAVESQVIEFPEDDGSQRDSEPLEDVRRELEDAPGVVSADYNYVREISAVPNDARYEGQANLEKISAPAAWDETTGEGATIAVIDTGVDRDHPDLEGKIRATKNTAEEGGSVAETGRGHGTHVAGIAAASTNNEIGVAGACPGCDLLIAKVEDDRSFILSSYIVEAINWSADNDADVINISLGAEGVSEAERRAVNRAVSMGSVVVAAAGNYSSNVKSYPAAYPASIAVAATTSRDTQADYSNYGNWIDISAPGTAISTIPDDAYGTKKGTSMSSPLVAGVAAMISTRGDFTPAQIADRLNSSAKDLGENGKDSTFGNGRLDAADAVGARERNAAPTISNRSPKPNATKGRRVGISATVRNAQMELEKSDIRLFVDGRSKGFSFDAGTGRLNRDSTFTPGKHGVKILASDDSGLRTKSKWTFVVPRR